MGNAVEFLIGGGKRGADSEYVQIGATKIINGVKGHIVKRRGDSDQHTNLPRYADTSEVYFRQNATNVCQARVYIGKKMCIDFDWSHNHVNKTDGRTFKTGTIHVQVWQWHSDGSFTRLSDAARLMNNFEMKRYGGIIKAFCPNVKFR
jgi:hypothetical protein